MKAFALVLAVFLFNITVNAVTFSYACKWVSGDNNDNFTIKILDEDNAEITFESSQDPYEGRFDYNYTPRYNKGFIRLALASHAGDEYTPDLIVEKALFDGGKKLANGQMGGTIKYQARGEGYFGGVYSCVAE